MASIRRRGLSFTITVSCGCDANGRQIRKNTTYHPPKGVSEKKAYILALVYAEKWEEDVKGIVALDENKTVQNLIDWYYSVIAPGILKSNTLVSEKADMKNHVLPYIGNKKIKDVTTSTIDALISGMRNCIKKDDIYYLTDEKLFRGVRIYKLRQNNPDISIPAYYRLKDGKGCRKDTALKYAEALNMPFDSVFQKSKKIGLMGSSIRKIIGTLSAVFETAVKKEMIRKNPCKYVTKPRNDAKPPEYLDELQSVELLECVHQNGDEQFEVLIHLLLSTGMRIGEALALHWDDIDMNKNCIYVRYTLSRIAGRWQRSTPKTEKSRRTIAIPERVTKMLKHHKEEQHESVWYSVEGPVFSTSNGNYYWATDLNRTLQKCISGSDLPHVHFHTLRHTHASLLINNGVAIKTISERLGHANTTMTLEVYSHMYEKADIKAGEVIGELLYHGSEEA